jgi:hypothetical protein
MAAYAAESILDARSLIGVEADSLNDIATKSRLAVVSGDVREPWVNSSNSRPNT